MSANPRALYYPSHILLDPTHSDRLYIAELTAVRKYQNGVLSKVFGPSDGSMGYAEGSADDVLSNGLSGMMLSPDGDVLYFSDGGNCRIRRCVNVTGAPAAAKTESFAGNGFAMGADGTGDNASINRPQFMAAARDDSSIVYVTSQAFVRRLNLKTRTNMPPNTPNAVLLTRSFVRSGELTTVLTRGLGCEIDPTGIAMTPSGLLLVACNATNCIYSINPITGDSHLVAGRLTARGTGRGFDADITACEFCDPNGICVVESERCLAVADSASHKIRRVPLCDHFFEPLPTASATSPKAK